MQSSYPRALVIGVVGVAMCSACGGSDGSTSSQTAASEPAVATEIGSPPTHDLASTEEALFQGTLEGDLNCIWISRPGGATAFVFQAGTTTQQTDEVVTLIDPEGNEIARLGDVVEVSGGYSAEGDSCLGDGEGVIVAGPVHKPVE